jgi:TPP-dependent pyruvate/acetoin dehydrogenase alpha subunit
MDVIAVHEAISEAANFARSTGPILVESLTYRYDGHGMSDKIYSTRTEELSEQLARDPITRLRTTLCDQFPDIGRNSKRLKSALTRSWPTRLPSPIEAPYRLPRI